MADINPIETNEWIDSINDVISENGIERANFLLKKIFFRILKKKKNNFILDNNYYVDNNYINTISYKDDLPYPGDLSVEKKIMSYIQWNSIMLVLRANIKKNNLGGHISTYQSFSCIYETCFNNFFKIYSKSECQDLVYFQGHSVPGIYSRSYLEGRISENQMNNFRKEAYSNGLSSYPHPYLMPSFWQFSTVSMGLSSLCAIYQARFLKYLMYRGIKDTSKQKVYVFLGDGEMDEAESKGLLNIAVRERLDNLIFLINCNLQRLDGPVYGNGKIINELSNFFLGAGWNIIRVIWGKYWDKLFNKDNSGILLKLVNETLDGEYQNCNYYGIKYLKKYFFGKYIETSKLIRSFNDSYLRKLQYGGHDVIKIYNAILKAVNNNNYKPTVIFFKTIKGYNLGNNIQASNDSHQVKILNFNELKKIRDKYSIPVKDIDLLNYPFVKFNTNSIEYNYLHHRRKSLGGYLPYRRKISSKNLIFPSKNIFGFLYKKKRKISSLMSFNYILNILLNYKKLSQNIVPIITDEARSLGLESLFKKIGIYNITGQQYIPQKCKSYSFYREDKCGQILQEGVNELGACASWIAASTSYSINNKPIIPFYISYSMFLFQRSIDLIWAAGDQRSRGFLIGSISGKTTLNGEGLQHQDGNSHIYSSVIPNCVSYDPAYSYELVVIILHLLKRMYGKKQEDIFCYLTLYNENYVMPSIDNFEMNDYGICKGAYKFKSYLNGEFKIQLLGSGSILNNVLKAASYLNKKFKINIDIYSVTSFTELAREGESCVKWNLLHPNNKKRIPYIQRILDDSVTIACTDYARLYAEQIRKFILGKYYVLGTDGYGLSDSRENLRLYFKIHYFYIVLVVLNFMYKEGLINIEIFENFKKKYLLKY